MGPGILCQLDWVVAKERGFFADEGLDVEFLDTDYTAANTVTGVGPNGPEFTDVGVVEYPALPRLASRVDNYYVVAGEHSGCRQLVVRADSPINTLEELGGARVAIDGATATAMWDYLVRTVNPETEGLRWEVGASPEAIADLLREGRVDAAVLVDPWDEELIAAGVARRVASNTSTEPVRNWYCCMLAVKSDLQETLPGLGPALTRAIRRGAQSFRRMRRRPFG